MVSTFEQGQEVNKNMFNGVVGMDIDNLFTTKKLVMIIFTWTSHALYVFNISTLHYISRPS